MKKAHKKIREYVEKMYKIHYNKARELDLKMKTFGQKIRGRRKTSIHDLCRMTKSNEG